MQLTGMQFVGYVAFLDSTKEDRYTKPMTFAVASDWFTSVVDYNRQAILANDYDGTEVYVNVYLIPSGQEFDDFVFDSDNLVQHIAIENPWCEGRTSDEYVPEGSVGFLD